MKNVMGVIDACSQVDALGELTCHRPLAAVPFAANYRLIDFILSSMVNSGISNIGIFTLQDKYGSLTDHLGSGREWDLDRKKDGLFLFSSDTGYEDYLKKSKQEYVIVSGSNLICNFNFLLPFNFHREVKADITILYKELPEAEKLQDCWAVRVGDGGRITEMGEPAGLKSNKISMEMYIMKRSLLLELTRPTRTCSGKWHIYDNILRNNLRNLQIYGFPYWGYLARINSIASYYKHSMDLLKLEVGHELFFQSNLIYTKIKDEPSVKYDENSWVRSALVANGCNISGKVENSILSRGGRVRKGAQVINSIVMAKCLIEENATVENCIIDKEVRITRGKIVKGAKTNPIVVKKGEVI